MNILAVEPYFGGSHRWFLESVRDLSTHQWNLITGPGRHWKWRMRVSPLTLARAVEQFVCSSSDRIDLIWVSDMLDLPQWRGFLANSCDRRVQRLATCPTVMYFHENQWTYPVASQARADHHYGYTNLLSAIAADAIWFNSAYHRDVFLDASESFLRRMPDSASAHDIDGIRSKSDVVPPGFQPSQSPCQRVRSGKTLRLGWVSRWEEDKRPDRFHGLLVELDRQGVPFELVLLGGRPQRPHEALHRIRSTFADRIRVDGCLPRQSELVGASPGSTSAGIGSYEEALQQMDVVISTAEHEFFGVGVCEAIWAGAVGLLPNDLSYPELVPADFLYASTEEAVAKIRSWAEVNDRSTLAERSRSRLSDLKVDRVVARMDRRLGDLRGANSRNST